MLRLRKYGHWYLLIGLALASLFVWRALFWIEVHRHLVFFHVFDVGQGDALLIEAPNGNKVLIDGGPDTAILSKLGRVLPFWDRSLDLLVLTHPHADHLDGLLEVLERYQVNMILESGVNHSIPEYHVWHALIGERSIPVVIAERGQVIHIMEGFTLTVLAPFTPMVNASLKNIHGASVILALAHASSSALLLSDAEVPLEYQLFARASLPRVDVLKIGHHGSKTSTSELLLAAVRPRLAVISAGRKNRYGHPAPEVLDRLRRFGIKVMRTDRDGDVTFVSDGRGFARRETLSGAHASGIIVPSR